MKRPIGILFLLLLLVITTTSWSQTTTGTISGRVLDPSGAILSGVSVKAVHVGTNLARTVSTNETGNFNILNLAPGVYRLEIEHPGFKQEIHPAVEVKIDDSLWIDASMEVGALSQSVEVKTGAPMLQTGDSSIGVVIGQRNIEDLPLISRQFETLALLTPGAVPAAPGSHLSSRGGFNVGGLDEHYTSHFLDGIDNVDPVIRNFSFRPPIDVIQEFKVQESGYNAEFGRNAGAVINVTTRSGSNALRGTVWEFIRNDNFDARNFFVSPDIPKPSLIRNQFGGTLGGALKRDKTFFFGGYEGLRQKTGLVRRATVPTERMRAGDLGELASTTPFVDPATGQPFQNSVIPELRMNPISRELLRAYPLPNRPGLANNRIEVADRIEDGNDVTLRIDHKLFEHTQLMGRYSYSRTRLTDPFRTETGGAVNLSNFGQRADRFRTNVGLTLRTVVGQNLVNEIRAGFNRFEQPQIPLNPGTPLQQPLMGIVKAFLNFGIGSGSNPLAPGNLDPLGSGAEFKRAVNVYNYIDNVSHTKGNHQLKAGVDVRRYLFNGYNVTPNAFIFTGLRTGTPPYASIPGNAFADFLLGLPTAGFLFNGSPGGNTRKSELAVFFQDDWKVSSRLTLNYGLRWEFYGRMTEKTNKQSIWDQACNCMKLAGADVREGLVENDWNNFAPRFGFAWQPLGNRTVVRGSAGIFYDNDMRTNLEFATNPPYFSARGYVPGSLTDPLPPGGGISPPRVQTMETHFRDTYAEQWSFGVQREIAADFLLDVAYVGNHMLKARRLRNINQPISGTSQPYTGFAQIFLSEQAGSSNYHSLQVRAEHRFSGGFSFLSSYTWSHAIDDRPGQGGGIPQNSYDFRAERADADFDVRHRAALSGVLELPFGPDKPWGKNWGQSLGEVLGGWNLNAVVTLQTGRPFTVVRRTNPSVSTVPADRPNAVVGVDRKPARQGPDQWINPAAFSIPPVFSFGNVPRNAYRGPGLQNVDVSLSKRSRIGEITTVEIRAEVFNVLNHPNFGQPNSVIDGPAFGAIPSTASPERQIQFGVKLGF